MRRKEIIELILNTAGFELKDYELTYFIYRYSI